MAAIIPVTPAPVECSFDMANTRNSYLSDDVNNILLNTFYNNRKKPYQVFLNADNVIWERDKMKKDRIIVPMENIIAVQSELNVMSTSITLMIRADQVVNDPNVDDNADKQQHSNIKQFTIVYAKRMENSSNPNKWRHFSQTFQNDDSEICKRWIQMLQKRIDKQTTRPKRLLLFVNPYGGKKRALQIYDGAVKPIFQLAGIDASVVISQRSHQIHDFIMTQSLEHFDGIVCIGGDGTFSELFNGIIFRTFKDLGISELTNFDDIPLIEKPIGIIPAGSTDTVAYCLNGTCDVRTTVLNIVLGQVNGLDLSSVSSQNGLLKFYASVMSYGFLGDVAIESEKFRWMGPKRYDYSGFKKLIRNRGYDGELTMLLAPNSNNPTSGPSCFEKCEICAKPTPSIGQMNQMSVIESATETTANKCENNNEQNTISSNDNHNSLSANQLTNNMYIDMNVKNSKDTTDSRNSNNDDNKQTEHQMKTINGKFFMVNGANISCACPRSPNGFSKYCHLCDGYIDLILVRHTSFFNNIRFLLAMSSRNCKIKDLSHVEIYRTKNFSFRPTGIQTGASVFNLHSSRVPISSTMADSSQTSVWNCDGEVIHDSEVFIRSHKHLINVYRRGLYNAHSDDVDGTSEADCCC